MAENEHPPTGTEPSSRADLYARIGWGLFFAVALGLLVMRFLSGGSC